MDISAELVRDLREATNLGMMECKKALVEAGGDKEKAVRLLRERGMAIAQKKSSRATNQGLLASVVKPDGRTGSLVEVNCETDFVARNSGFVAFVGDLAAKACDTDRSLADSEKDRLVAKVAEIGENLVVRRNLRYVLACTGTVASYIHLGGKIGVLVEAACGKPESVGSGVFKEAVKDICMHIAASSPMHLDRTAVPKDVLAAEREIYAKQITNKPANIVEKIVDGKIKKFISDNCLVAQPFVKDPKITVTDYLNARGREIGDTITIRRFARWQLGQG